MQRNSHLKIAECYNNKNATSEQVEQCAHNCSAPLQHVQAIVQNELNQFQNRLGRCTQECQDEITDKFHGAENNAQTQAKAEQMMLACANSCVDKHVSLLKSIQHKLERDIDSVAK